MHAIAGPRGRRWAWLNVRAFLFSINELESREWRAAYAVRITNKRCTNGLSQNGTFWINYTSHMLYKSIFHISVALNVNGDRRTLFLNRVKSSKANSVIRDRGKIRRCSLSFKSKETCRRLSGTRHAQAKSSNGSRHVLAALKVV